METLTSDVPDVASETVVPDKLCQDMGDDKKPKRIEFAGVDSPLSNLFPCRVEAFGRVFSSVEHAYQYRKALYHGDVDCAERIKAAKHARLAKTKSKQIGETRSGWNDVRVHWMRHLLLAKFKTSKELRAVLMATGNAELVEFVSSKEGFWGLGRGYKNGRNTLGKLLCDVRDNDM